MHGLVYYLCFAFHFAFKVINSNSQLMTISHPPHTNPSPHPILHSMDDPQSPPPEQYRHRRLSSYPGSSSHSAPASLCKSKILTGPFSPDSRSPSLSHALSLTRHPSPSSLSVGTSRVSTTTQTCFFFYISLSLCGIQNVFLIKHL